MVSSNNILPIERTHPLYPRTLMDIPDSPETLYCQGNLSLLNSHGVAIVGTRNPTNWGKQVAYFLGYKLAREGYTVVSGLCEGCDLEAHRGALEACGHTIAILCGWRNIIHDFQPHWRSKILEGNGLLLAEHAPNIFHGKGVCGRELVRRDRLQAAFPLAIILVQGDQNSGTRHALIKGLEYSRAVLFPKINQVDLAAHPAQYGLQQKWSKVPTFDPRTRDLFDLLEDEAHRWTTLGTARSLTSLEDIYSAQEAHERALAEGGEVLLDILA